MFGPKNEIEKRRSEIAALEKVDTEAHALLDRRQAELHAADEKWSATETDAAWRVREAAREEAEKALLRATKARKRLQTAHTELRELGRADLERRYRAADLRRTYSQFVKDAEPIVLKILELERSTSAAARELAVLMKNATAARAEALELGAQLGIAQVGGDQPTIDWITRLVAARIKSDNAHPTQEFAHYAEIVKGLIQTTGGAPATKVAN